MKRPEEIAVIIDGYNLDDRESLRELEARIRKTLPIREILLFAAFLHGGDFTSSSGKWHRNLSGYVAQTHQEDAALTRLWEALVRSCYVLIGAASVLKIQDSRLLAGCAFADEGDGPTIYDYSVSALAKEIPRKFKKQLDAASRFDRLQQTAEETKKEVGETRQGVAVLVQHLPNAKKPKTISWKEAASVFYPPLTAKKTNGEFCHTENERKKLIDSFSRNCRNWIKEGRCPKSGTPISWDDLTSTQAWEAWVEQEKIDARKPRFVSEKTGLVEDQRGRRRSPTAQSGK